MSASPMPPACAILRAYPYPACRKYLLTMTTGRSGTVRLSSDELMQQQGFELPCYRFQLIVGLYDVYPGYGSCAVLITKSILFIPSLPQRNLWSPDFSK